ncbi:MAG TPA: M1 family metallopeptidase [Candidatus Limiplasma sp.]|nr:M1 family metallopeptidase [Candidatus Limiplasma sp.]HPS81140.1 M1 family metallopeptidase [Candidatus Limiplasma sp.]
MAVRRKRLWLAAGALALACLAALCVWRLTAPGETLAADPPGATLLEAAQGLDDIVINADFDPVTRTLQVNQTLALTNRTGVTQRLVVLRTYPNAFQSEDTSPAATDELYDACYPNGFSKGMLEVDSLTLQMPGGDAASPAWSYGDDAQTVLRVSLPEDWVAGASLMLRMNYTVRVPQAAYRFGENNGLWAIGNAFAIPAVFMDGEYLTDDYISIGDPFVSECRNYTVNLTAPEAYVVVGSGVPTADPVQNGQRTTHFSALAARDFSLCISRQYALSQARQGSVLVNAYATSASQARLLARLGAQALACYADRYGPYPYPVFSLCEVDFPFDGMEYPTLAMISTRKLKQGGDALEQLVAHETAHQWWCAVVGNDQYRQAWQDEALAQFSLLDYWETRYGTEARHDLQYSQVDTSMLVTVPQGVTPGSPVDYFGDLSEYSLVVYGRGAAALCALDTAMQGKLDGFLSNYYHTYAFQLATRADFETLLKTYTGEDWSPLLSDYLDTYMN